MDREKLADYFYKIANNQIESNIILQDEYMTAILDINPINKGHVLILPRTKKQEFIQLSTFHIPQKS